ncbi:hypothetical protein [Flavobacterium sp.]|jgi:PBP1b-binding outer membrane lipoprotein LpoB|uniref:hypothetical protein n=1 Tax=Flavobacterium sp. TaxID=239 RepID=UPI00261E95DA|nr:hypothetical protein [Flavobacterium sp.]
MMKKIVFSIASLLLFVGCKETTQEKLDAAKDAVSQEVKEKVDSVTTKTEKALDSTTKKIKSKVDTLLVKGATKVEEKAKAIKESAKQ